MHLHLMLVINFWLKQVVKINTIISPFWHKTACNDCFLLIQQMPYAVINIFFASRFLNIGFGLIIQLQQCEENTWYHNIQCN